MEKQYQIYDMRERCALEAPPIIEAESQTKALKKYLVARGEFFAVCVSGERVVDFGVYPFSHYHEPQDVLISAFSGVAEKFIIDTPRDD